MFCNLLKYNFRIYIEFEVLINNNVDTSVYICIGILFRLPKPVCQFLPIVKIYFNVRHYYVCVYDYVL